jgi:hypothetical protein
LATLGSLYVTRPILKRYTLSRNELVQRAMSVFDAIASGTRKLRIEHVYQLNEAAQAHRDLEARSTTGKLLIAFDHVHERISMKGQIARPQVPEYFLSEATGVHRQPA